MSMFSIMGIAVIGVIITVLIKQYLPEYAILVIIMTSIIILFWIVVNMMPVLDKILFFIRGMKVPNDYIEIVIKSLGLAFVIQLISDLCKDAGVEAISSKIELVGKVGILIISLPLFEKIMTIIFELIK